MLRTIPAILVALLMAPGVNGQDDAGKESPQAQYQALKN